MTMCQLVLQNQLAKGVELNLSPWRGAILTLPPDHRALLNLELPDDAWVEVEVTELAVFIHGWPGTACDLDLFSPDIVTASKHRAWSADARDAELVAVRPPTLRGWASQQAGASLRAMVTDSREAVGEIALAVSQTGPDSIRSTGARSVLLVQRPARPIPTLTSTTVTLNTDAVVISGDAIQLEAVTTDCG